MTFKCVRFSVLGVALFFCGCGGHNIGPSTGGIELTNRTAREQIAVDMRLAADKAGLSIRTEDMIVGSRHDLLASLTRVTGEEFDMFAYIALPMESQFSTSVPAGFYHVVVRPPSVIPGGEGSATFRSIDGREVLRDYPVTTHRIKQTRLRRGLHLAVADQKLSLGGCVKCSDGIGWCVITASFALASADTSAE